MKTFDLEDTLYYPAILSHNEDGCRLQFVDLDLEIKGKNTGETLKKASEVIYIFLNETFEKDKIPMPSEQLDGIKLLKNEVTVFIEMEKIKLMGMYGYEEWETVKKTLTIPKKLDELARKYDINFSFVLRNAIMEEIRKIQEIKRNF